MNKASRILCCMLALLCLLPMTANAQAQCSHSYSSWMAQDDSTHSATCTLCGETVTASHQYEELWTVDAQNHMHKCSLCGHAADVQAHTWPERWEGDAVNHIRLCTVCQVAGESRDHSWDGGKTVRIAGLFTNGKRAFTCAVCTYVRTDTLPAHKTLGIVLVCALGLGLLTAAIFFIIRSIKKRASDP